MAESYVAFNIQISNELSAAIEAEMERTKTRYMVTLGRALLWEALRARQKGEKG